MVTDVNPDTSIPPPMVTDADTPITPAVSKKPPYKEGMGGWL